jgi:two-component system chemotaxis response regulator CheB
MQKLLARAATETGEIEVIAVAGNVEAARNMIKQKDPDVLTLDVEMPGMDGLSFLEKIIALRPMPVVMVSSLTDAGTDTALRAMEIGAVDALPKPGGSFPLPTFGRALRKSILAAARSRMRRSQRNSPTASGQKQCEQEPQSMFTPDLIALGASTGGVAALSTVLSALPENGPPVVITQHIPPSYAQRFAKRLSESLGRDIAVARDAEVLSTGCVRLAPGDQHLRVAGHARRIATQVFEGPPVAGHVPSVDVLFESISNSAVRSSAALLTGMGRDGAEGLKMLRDAGHLTIAQNEESCVVYGMPKAAVELGAAQRVLPLDHIPQAFFTLYKERRGKTMETTESRSLPYA